MPDDFWALAAAALAFTGLIAYALFAGADFGAGVWDIFSTGPRQEAQREAIYHAMGPVWEANHVWLIFIIVVLFTCFPYAFAPLVTALFLPLHLALAGIMLRGAAFVFRSYGRDEPLLPGEHLHAPVWQTVFGASSIITPFLMGAVFGSITSGNIRVSDGIVSLSHPYPWLTPYALSCGALALATCAYLAAVYLCVETAGPLRDDFRRRAIIAGTSTAALAFVTLVLAKYEAPWFFHRLFDFPTILIIAAGMVAFALSAWAVFTRRYRTARLISASQITLLLVGWAAAHYPYLLYPDLTLAVSAGPTSTTRFLVLTCIPGLLAVVPSLIYLLRIFKTAPSHTHI